jgi:hypothetical protein
MESITGDRAMLSTVYTTVLLFPLESSIKTLWGPITELVGTVKTNPVKGPSQSIGSVTPIRFPSKYTDVLGEKIVPSAAIKVTSLPMFPDKPFPPISGGDPGLVTT